MRMLEFMYVHKVGASDLPLIPKEYHATMWTREEIEKNQKLHRE